ncbi:DNA polymerase III subunit beta [Halonatronum saccharophilum]|uniref:DNA polymerase III subunit beta n=1 Tax=Halonatronum saccharophilum TaxID=150060 RepID=UPI000484ED6B|nr:DNA polymerase III subunit beta [Halonatronum saccharophilum]
MKLELGQKGFYQGINIVRKAVASNRTLPILSSILIKAESGRIKLIATDLEVGIESFVEGKVLEEGSVLLPANYLANIIKELPREKIKLELDSSKTKVSIKCRGSHFSINAGSPDDFPLLPEVKGALRLKVKQGKLKEMIDSVDFAVSQDQTKPFLAGGLLMVEDGEVRFIATDTYRLAYKYNVIEDKGVSAEAIIPRKSMNELSKLLADLEDEVEVAITQSQVLFEFSGIVVVSRLIEGQFPNYKHVIPNTSKTQVSLKKGELLKAVKRAALLARQDDNIIKLSFSPKELVITAKAPQVGKAYEKVKISLKGEEAQIAFNVNYLIDSLKVVAEQEVIIELSGPLAPGVVKTKKEDYISVIMPVRSA